MDNAEVGAVFEEVGGKGVAEQVGVNVLGEASGFGGGFGELPDAVWGEGTSVDGKQEMAARDFPDERGAFVFEIAFEGFGRFCADRQDAGFVAFTGDAEDAVFEVEMFEAGVAEF